jgi:hypothetical protein
MSTALLSIEMTPPKEPAVLARVTIYEIAERPWGWLVTNAWVDDYLYVGTQQWRQQQLGHSRTTAKPA